MNDTINMTPLKDRVENALNESRILILGVEILIGFDYRSVFETSFDRSIFAIREARVLGLLSLLVAVALLIFPSAYHRITCRGEDTEDLIHFSNWVTAGALFFFALGLGTDFFIVLTHLSGPIWGWAAGLLFTGLALFFWYILEGWLHSRVAAEIKEIKRMNREDETAKAGGTPLKDKIRQVSTEIRVVLPGVQAMLGFQFAIVLQDSFDRLDPFLKTIHLGSLIMIGISTILLMAPAAYHRIVDQGEDTQRFNQFASQMILVSLLFLALGFTGDLYLVVYRVYQSRSLALAASIVALIVFYGTWFGYSYLRRTQLEQSQSQRKVES